MRSAHALVIASDVVSIVRHFYSSTNRALPPVRFDHFLQRHARGLGGYRWANAGFDLRGTSVRTDVCVQISESGHRCIFCREGRCFDIVVLPLSTGRLNLNTSAIDSQCETSYPMHEQRSPTCRRRRSAPTSDPLHTKCWSQNASHRGVFYSVTGNIAMVANGNITADCVVCFEHGEVYLYHRLLCMESVAEGNSAGLTMDDIRRAALRNTFGEPGLEALLETIHTAKDAWSRIVQYWERLYLSKGHPVKMTLNVLDTYLTRLWSQYATVVLFVDYLQKIPVFSPGIELTPERQIRTVTEGLKNLALANTVPIVAVAASDAEGVKEGRVRFEDLGGGTSVNYEPDVAVMLNPTRQEEQTRVAEIIFSMEKNRLGPTGVEFHIGLQGEHFVFFPKASPDLSSSW